MDTVEEKAGSDWLGKVNLVIGFIIGVLVIWAMFSSQTPATLQVQGFEQAALTNTAAAPDQPIWLLMVIGLAIGCYGTIIGIGGGPLIVPILVFFYGWENEILVATSLFIVFLNAASGCAGYAMQKRIDYKGAVRFTLAAMPGAFISSYVHHLINLTFFNVIFGAFLILLSVYTIFSISRMEKTRKEKQEFLKEAKAEGYRRAKFTDAFGVKYDYYSNDRLGIVMNLLLGFFCGFLGIGGGVFQVPILLFLLFYPVHIATATSQFVTLLTCMVALIPHVFWGNVMYAHAMWMGVGVIVGAQIGAQIAARLNTRVTLYLFIMVLIVFAVKLFMG